jgi:hypothetical protein
MVLEAEKSDVTPFWCVVANIVQERHYGPSGTLNSRGTKHFPAGAKVHILNLYWGMGGETTTVVGRHRGSHRYVTMDIKTSCLTNPRVELVYSPHITRQISVHRRAHKPSRHEPSEDDANWGASEEYKKIVEALNETVKATIAHLQREIGRSVLKPICNLNQ